MLDGEGGVVLSRRVEATEEQLEAALSEISRVGSPDERVVGIDILGGLATLLEALLLARGERVRYLPGTAVNRARDAYAGGERKSDPGDAFVIADQVRMRWRSLSEVRPKSEDLEEARVLVGHRAGLVQERVRRITPVLRASGKVSFQRRARKGNRALKQVFYRSAFCALSCHEPSQEYYRRKRAEGKGAPQAIIALARRRVNVLWAMLRDGAFYEDRSAAAT